MIMRTACKMWKVCALLVVLCLLHAVSPLSVQTHRSGSNMCCAFSGWVPAEGYVPRRLRQEAKDARREAGHNKVQTLKTCKTPRAPFRPWRQHAFHHPARTREVLSNSTVVAVASLMQDTKHENKRLQQEVRVQRQEIANLRTHMSALELEAELRDFWRKEFKEVRYVGNDTFVVAYTVRL